MEGTTEGGEGGGQVGRMLFALHNWAEVCTALGQQETCTSLHWYDGIM